MLLPVPYFMVTFTLPQQLRAIARSNQKLIYDLLFKTAAAALQELAQDRRFVGGQIGMVGLLQTWKRDLSYHPHVHFIVPGGGLSADGGHWLASGQRFLVHVKPLSKLFRGKFRAALKKSELYQQVPQQVWQQEWVVHSKAVGNGQAALKYVAPYIFRVAISNKRIIKVAEGKVTFRYTPAGSKKSKLRTLPAEEFIHRFLQHVLPRGFVKVRYYGLFSPGRLKQARALLEAQNQQQHQPEAETTSTEQENEQGQQPTIVCSKCGQAMQWQQKIRPQGQHPP
jgi:hypothetical protein